MWKMINILILMAGKNEHFNEEQYPFPRPLIEIGQKTIIELVIQNLSTVGKDIEFIFVLSASECKKYHLDTTLNIITNKKCKIVYVNNATKGAACSALLAVKHIKNDCPLIIANSDQLFDDSIQLLLSELKNADAGVVTFDSVHPRWSYARTNERGEVVETMEKHPISRNAIAGMYYFKRGEDFIDATMQSILKNSTVNGNYYIAPALNEMILNGKNIKSVKVENKKYHTLYSPQKIKEYEEHVNKVKIINSNE